MKSVCLLAMAIHIVSCITTDPSTSSSPAIASQSSAPASPLPPQPPASPDAPSPSPEPEAPSPPPASDAPASDAPAPAPAPAPPTPAPTRLHAAPHPARGHAHSHSRQHGHAHSHTPAPAVGISGAGREGRTDSPMLLGYIFDIHSPLNKHHHHDHRWGPHFEDVELGANATNITVQVGSTANLNCKISLLQDKTVSWVRRKHGSDEMELITVGMHTYSSDARYSVEFQYPNNWRLQIKYTVKRDEGMYECQISTHPPKVIQINLHINAPEVVIVDEQGNPIQDKYYEADSTIQLSCIVRHVSMTSSAVAWLHGDRTLNYDVQRGGISVRTDLMEEGANSTLSVARVNKTDAGNYTCSISPSEFATVTVHVLNGESLAELHHGSAACWGGGRSGASLGANLLLSLAVAAAAAGALPPR